VREDSGRKAHLSTVASAKVEDARKTQGKPEWEKRRVGEGEKEGHKTQGAGRRTQGKLEGEKGRKKNQDSKKKAYSYGSPPCLSAVAEAKAERG